MNLLNILFHEIFDWERFDSLMLGTLTVEDYAAAFIFSAMGQIIAIRLHAFWRDKESDRTPRKWSTRFFIVDNLKRFITGMTLMFLVFRFFGEITEREFGMFYTVLIGLGFSFGLDIIILRSLKNRLDFFNTKSVTPKDE